MTLPTNKKLEQLFDLPESGNSAEDFVPSIPVDRESLDVLDETIDKIEAALPQVKGLDLADEEFDELAKLAVDGYKDLSELGMQVDSRFASDIFSVASNMLGHAITAKTAKLDKKLKMIDLQLKKARLDQSQPEGAALPQQGTGHVLSRNELLEKILAGTRQKGTNE